MLSRRNFLGLAGGVVVLAACGGSDDDGSDAANTAAHDHDERAHRRSSPAVLSSDLYVVDDAAAVRVRDARRRRASHPRAPASVAVAPDGTTADASSSTTDAARGRDCPRAAASTSPTLVFDRDGVWDGVADRDGEKLPFVFQVKAHGRRADRSVRPRRPTRRRRPPNALGVDPICTRDPMCPLHTESLDTTDRQGQAGRGVVRDAGALPVAVLRAGARQPAAARRRLPGPRRTSCTSTSTRTSAPTRRRRPSPRGTSRASRGSSASTRPARSRPVSTARSARTR